MRLLAAAVAAAAALVLSAGASPPSAPSGGPTTQVVVTLASPPLARASGAPEAAARIADEQRAFEERLARALPGARVRWRYRLVANGVSVVLPARAVPVVERLSGVRDVFTAVRYTTSRAGAATAPAARAAWSPGLPGAGEGLKIGIIDDGLDQTHPYFDPAGYAMPPGYPKGQTAYTTAKVIVARAFPPPRTTWRFARRPFDPEHSGHGTHVAGIAAGNADTATDVSRRPRASGVAPRAFLGNYKALTVPTDSGVGLDGNAPELVAAIEAAVADGMDVINLSIGEPEIEPSRDLVALALDAAAAAGVVPVVAAGNDYAEFGRGSLASPGTAASAITVGAVTDPAGAVADFSSAGPTALSLRLKPDVAAPGVGIVSSVPGGWQSLSGTSMATPHVAGAVALLLERHPSWTPEQVKAALVATANPARLADGTAPPARAGAGIVDLPDADQPLLAATPASVSFGLVRRGDAPAADVTLTDLGGGAGEWAVAVRTLTSAAAARLDVPATVTVPGTLRLTAVTAGDELEELSGVVTLAREGIVRRIPFWLRVWEPLAPEGQPRLLAGPGTYRGDTRGRPSQLDAYRYPEPPAGSSTVRSRLLGPEQRFRVVLPAPVANFGVVITSRGSGVTVEPRVVADGDASRLVGYASLPLVLNPYLAGFGEPVLAAGAVRPLAGAYDVVFDSPSTGGAGPFGFRFWIDDTTPPTVSLRTRVVRRGSPVVVRVSDAGSGVDPSTLELAVDGRERTERVRAGVLRISTRGLRPGVHRLRIQISDYQESRNTENVPAILPNTRVQSARFTVRR